MMKISLSSLLENRGQQQRPSLSAGAADARLLQRFLQNRDEAAFEMLMWRHGPMVYGVCRRILQHIHDAEDAFQATFLMLARKAASIGKDESVSGWLYMVAYRIALRARAQKARLGRVEQSREDLPIDDKSGDPADQASWRELSCLVDAELSRIPEKYRTAFILCHLEGKTCEEAAAHLGCPRGTILSRLDRARKRLQTRLTLRGWVPASTPLTHLLEQHASPLLEVSPVLVHATAHAALLASLGKLLIGAASPSVLALTGNTMGVLRLHKLPYLALLILLALLSSSVVVWGMLALGPKANPAATAPANGTVNSCHGCSTPQEP